MGAKSVIRRSKRNELHWIQNGCCFWCDEPVAVELATLDELHARGKGGTARWGNIVMSCINFNHARGSSQAPLWAIRQAKSMALVRSAAQLASRIISGEVVIYRPSIGNQ